MAKKTAFERILPKEKHKNYSHEDFIFQLEIVSQNKTDSLLKSEAIKKLKQIDIWQTE